MTKFPKNIKFITTPRFLDKGVSTGNYANFNLATYTGDDLDAVRKNRQLLIKHFDLPSEPKWLKQVHLDTCLIADEINDIVEADASITQTQGIVCAVLTADCLPIFATDIKGGIVGVAHAGWQGILNGVIESFIKKININSDDLLIHLGPAISVKALELGKDVYDNFVLKNKDFSKAFVIKEGKYFLDIYKIARIILTSLAVKNITGGDECTFLDKDKYFSFRRQGANSGRMASLIWIE